MSIKKLIPLPVKVAIYQALEKSKIYVINNFFPEKIIDDIYYDIFGRHIDLKNPKDLNEKINWLKINSDLREWTRLSDKYRVREFLKEKGLGDLAPRLYGVYDSAADIDFKSIPDSFVIKANHGSGDSVIVRDKSKINESEIREKFQKLLEEKYGISLYEPQYYKIQPKIICEQLLENSHPELSSSLVDYKIWCFDGHPYAIMVILNRTKEHIDMIVYDVDWQEITYAIKEDTHYRKYKDSVPKPTNLIKMLEIASVLSESFPEVRVDLYDVDDKIYFGEMTFTSMGGFMGYYTQRFLDELGQQVNLNH